ncbi:hypothetical protein [Phaeobacter piscinae]|uniref:hypothetical protein n=1 Tax=Phaeobacter piscinae TaxID=1580596 RepID=UPI000F48FE2A|nr:hypothetical protein [Phaeobacter piscinae]
MTYVRLKGRGRPKTFERAAHRSLGYVIGLCGGKRLSDYTKADANAFCDALIKPGLTEFSIIRIFGTVWAVFNSAEAKEGLEISSPIANVCYDRNAGVSERFSLPAERSASFSNNLRS